MNVLVSWVHTCGMVPQGLWLDTEWVAVPLLCAGTGELRHGTEGWKCLETSLRALQQLLGGLPAAAVAAAADEEVLQLTFRYVQ